MFKKESKNIQEELKTKLQSIIPSVFSEGKLDFEKLKALVNDDFVDFNEERYHLSWAGKSDCFRVIQEPSTDTLVPCKEESVNWDETENVYIEGENLEVLKILQKSYYGKIKMIYIDPPYNTGNDSFIYPDKFSETRDEYERRAGEKDEEGYITREGYFRKNSKESGKYHSNWLSMMYPRLFLARNLLKEDGVIFVSIDDNEVHNLRNIMNEIFGEENFIGIITVQSNPRGSQSSKYLGITHEYILVYSKVQSEIDDFGLALPDEMRDEYNLMDSNGKKYRLLGLRQRGGAWRRSQRPSLFFPIFIDPMTKLVSLEKSDNYHIEVYPIKPTTNEDGSWRWSKDKILNNLESLYPKEVSRDNKNTWDIYQKDYLVSSTGEERTTKAKSIWFESEINYQNGTTELKTIFEGLDFFDFPKPTYLIKKIIELSLNDTDSIILDFFSGSSSSAHALLELNKQDNGNRKFIMVQLPEKTEDDSEAFKAGYENIAEIGKERIRRVIKNIEKEKEEKPDLFEDKNLDLGFKVFKHVPSNFKEWRLEKKDEQDKIAEQLEVFNVSEKEDNTKENILYELLIKSGCKLSDKIEEVIINESKYYRVGVETKEGNEHKLIFIIDSFTEEITKKIIDEKPNNVICLESSFNNDDQLKTNTLLQMKDNNIEFITV